MAKVVDFDLMFTAGMRFYWEVTFPSVIEIQAAGRLKLPSGRLVVQDPGWRTRPPLEPFEVTVAPGAYTVELSISRWDQVPVPGMPVPVRRVNAAKVRVIDEPVVHWELARPAGKGSAEADDGTTGFPVDSGTGCFFDVSARRHVERMQFESTALEDAMLRVLDLNAVEVATDDPSCNVIVFKCGMGDGLYQTWIGRTASGAVACFVADLELLHDSVGSAR